MDRSQHVHGCAQADPEEDPGLWNSKSHETFVPLYDLRVNKVNQILTIRLDTTADKLGKVKLHLDTSEILTMDGDFDYGRC